MRYRDTIAVLCKNFMGHTLALYAQNAGVAGVKPDSKSTARFPCVDCFVSCFRRLVCAVVAYIINP